MEDLIKYKTRIEEVIVELGKCRRKLEAKGKAKAETLSDYDRRIAVAIVSLRDGDDLKLGDRIIKPLPVSVMEKVAKGICRDDRLAMDMAESAYKACITNIQVLMAQLNAYQSIYRHLEEG